MNQFVHSVKLKIILAFGACIALMIAIGLFGAAGLYRLNSNMNKAYFDNTVAIGQLSDVRAAQLNIRVKLRRIQLTRAADDISKTLPGIEANLATMSKAWSDYYPAGISSDKERQIADRIAPIINKFTSNTSDVITLLEAGNFDAATELSTRAAALADSLTQALNDDATLNMAQAKLSADDSNATFRTLLWIVVALVGVGVIIATGVTAYLLRAISAPLSEAVIVANHIASGRLENDIQITSRDEFGQLLEALKRMDQQLSNTIRGIKGS
ncbi:HAMP domain-containing protein, partial [Paraburkholderia madseniana]